MISVIWARVGEQGTAWSCGSWVLDTDEYKLVYALG